MKRNDNSQNNTYNIRGQSTICEDIVKIIAYPFFFLITWNIGATTKLLLENMLGEKFEDLYTRIILNKNCEEQYATDFPISKSCGVLRIEHLSTGVYDCEVVVSNSRNEMITVKRSNSLHCIQSKESSNHPYRWKKVIHEDPFWLKAYAGYTLYE
ncbi:hypothetical protein WQ54_30930 [Bacillus sp. SA1-12]|uniref:hypothetical protein n=1 Tax=Bacillus sp. SA1-12 TaxID=1455638 RepID=UPI000626F0B9|nr:hypothetical protein [Bacillus sp. SA1-12]KKI88610.1 hypothetical protein WQ54_30930 [Bacillus sp. SA1-12]